MRGWQSTSYNMNNPVKEFLKDHNPSEIHTPEWVSRPVDAIETAWDKAGDELSSAFSQGIHFCKSAKKRLGKQVNEAEAILRHNPYPTIFIGILFGSVIGYIVVSRFNRGSA